MHIKGYKIEVIFATYFTPFIVTFAKRSPVIDVIFSDVPIFLGNEVGK
jgi:hypothetical protein